MVAPESRYPLPVLRHAVTAELRQTLRDTNTLLLSLLFPLLFFPFALWVTSQVQAVVTGWEGTLRPTVAADVALANLLPEDVLRVDAGSPAAVSLVQEGRIVRLSYSSVDPVSQVARERVEKLFEPDFKVMRHDVSPRADRVATAMAIAMPMLLLIMAALSGMYPAIEAVVADRERGTQDTSLVTAAPRWVFPAAKLIAVATITLFAVLGSAVSTVASIAHFAFTLGVDVDFPIGRLLALFPLAAAAALVAAGIATAAASPARNFKQAQNFATTSNSVLLLLPLATMANPEARITVLTGSIPYLNLALVMRDVLLGRPDPVWIAVACAESVLVTVIAGAIAMRFLRRES